MRCPALARLRNIRLLRKARLILPLAAILSLHDIGYAEKHGVPNLAQQWTSAALHAIRDAKLGAPVVARALAIVHTCMYEAWTAYDEGAVGTQLGGALYRPASEDTLADKEQAISYVAYRALVDVQPVDTNSVYVPLIKQLGYDPSHDSTDIETPTGIGNVAPSDTWKATYGKLTGHGINYNLLHPGKSTIQLERQLPRELKAGNRRVDIIVVTVAP